MDRQGQERGMMMMWAGSAAAGVTQRRPYGTGNGSDVPPASRSIYTGLCLSLSMMSWGRIIYEGREPGSGIYGRTKGNCLISSQVNHAFIILLPQWDDL